jgi:probable DNA repair protein
LIRLPQDVFRAIELGQTVLVPSRQRSEAVRLAYAAQALAAGRTVWNTPDVLPLDTWLTREIERCSAAGQKLPRLLSAAEDWLVWRQSTADRTQDIELISSGPLAEALRRASQLADEYLISISGIRALEGTEGQLLVDVEKTVAARCSSMGAATASRLATARAITGGSQDVLLAGFERITPRLETLITARGAAGYVTTLRKPDDRSEARTRYVLAGDPAEELERVAEWCRARLATQTDARLLVLAPGAPEARERLVTLIRQHVDPAAAVLSPLLQNATNSIAAIEGGLPLSRNPLAAHALSSLSWLTRGMEFAEFSAWLCSPLWPIAEAARARLDLWLRERSLLEVDPRRLLSALEVAPESLRAVASDLAARVSQASRALSGSARSPREWSEQFAAALLALGWPGERVLTSAEAQTHDRLIQLLDDFGGLTSSTPSMSVNVAVQCLNELAARTSFRPASGDALVTISSQLADPIVQYDGIWVCGLHADAWPAPVQPDPFLPLQAQIAAGVPAASAVERAAEARTLMNAWAQATSELVLSSPLRAEDVQLSPSPLVLRFASYAGEPEPAPSVWLPKRLQRENLTEFIEDRLGPQWDVTRPLPSGTRSVELQNLCPFRSYGELRLGSEPLEAPEPGVAPDVRGKLLHTSLEKVWRILRSSEGLAAYDDDALRVLVTRCVEEAATEVMGRPRSVARAPAEQRECRRAVRLIHLLCDLERKRPAFTVRAMERDSELHLAGAQLRLRIDRLDELASGGLAILDYKSGRPIPGDWYSERPSHPQLLAYLAAIGRETVAMATVSVTAREIRFDGVAAAGNLLPKVRAVEPPTFDETQGDAWTLRQMEWIARVEQLVADFVNGQAAVDPRPKACEYCHVVSVCRISDVGPDAVERNVDE